MIINNITHLLSDLVSLLAFLVGLQAYATAGLGRHHPAHISFTAESPANSLFVTANGKPVDFGCNCEAGDCASEVCELRFDASNSGDGLGTQAIATTTVAAYSARANAGGTLEFTTAEQPSPASRLAGSQAAVSGLHHPSRSAWTATVGGAGAANTRTEKAAGPAVGILYEGWHTYPAQAMLNISASGNAVILSALASNFVNRHEMQGGQRLTVENVIRSNGSLVLSDILEKWVLFAYRFTPTLVVVASIAGMASSRPPKTSTTKPLQRPRTSTLASTASTASGGTRALASCRTATISPPRWHGTQIRCSIQVLPHS